MIYSFKTRTTYYIQDRLLALIYLNYLNFQLLNLYFFSTGFISFMISFKRVSWSPCSHWHSNSLIASNMLYLLTSKTTLQKKSWLFILIIGCYHQTDFDRLALNVSYLKWGTVSQPRDNALSYNSSSLFLFLGSIWLI